MDGGQLSGFESGPMSGEFKNPSNSLQDRANILFLAYRYTQGGIGLHNRMLLYVEENGYPDLFGVSDEEVEELQGLARPMIGRYYLKAKLHPATPIPWEDSSEVPAKVERHVDDEIEYLWGRFYHDRKELRDFDSSLTGIAQGVIVMDADYLRRPGGRADDAPALRVTVDAYRGDPYDSQFVTHSILGKDAKVFSGIFQQLATEEVIGQLDQHALRQLRFVIETYVLHHPDIKDDERLAQVKAWMNFDEVEKLDASDLSVSVSRFVLPEGDREPAVAELKQLAKSQPKVEQAPPGLTSHVQYGDNFYRRFGEIQAIREGTADDAQVFYVQFFKEKLAGDLLLFYGDYPQLCDAICNAVTAKEPYDRLVSGYHELLRLEEKGEVPAGSAQELNEATGHPLGIEAIGMYYWGKINPLLEQAASIINERTRHLPYLMK